MTVTLYSITPPTTTTSSYLLRPTALVAPSQASDWVYGTRERVPEYQHLLATRTLDDIDDWYSQEIEDDGFLERLEKSAEITRFP